MTTRVRWLLLVGVALVGIAGLFALLLPRILPPPMAVLPHPLPIHAMAHFEPQKPPFTDAQFQQFMVDARKAETIEDPLQRCLAYPDPPGLNWSKAATVAYCHYVLDPLVSREEARDFIQSGRTAELDRRYANILHAQLTQPNSQAVLDRTFNADFSGSSEANRALIDAWKRQDPKSPFALAASGISYVSMAWDARGGEYADKTPQSAFDDMNRLLEQARTDLDAAVQIEPKLTSAYATMIWAAGLSGDVAYGVEAAKHGLAADPANFSIYGRLVWMAQPKWEGTASETARIVAGAQRHAKENPLLLLLLSERTGGESYVENCQCNPLEEERMYQQLFAEPAPERMLARAGWAAESRGASNFGAIYRSEALRFVSDDIQVRQSRAFELPGLDQMDWAISEGNALVALTPQDENSYEARGRAYEVSGQTDRAIQDYQQALQLNPDDAWALVALADLYVHTTHDWDKGWAVTDRVLQLHPEDQRAWLLRADIQKGQPRDGLDQTIADFKARFGDGPDQQVWIAQMKEKQPPAVPTAH